MNRKHNPLVALAALVLLAAILVLVCAGCETDTAAAADISEDRFTVTTEWHNGVTLYIATDTETGVQYLFTGSRSGIIALQSGED